VKAYYVDAGTGEPRTDNILKTVGGVVGVGVGVFPVEEVGEAEEGSRLPPQLNWMPNWTRTLVQIPSKRNEG